jgi:aspartate aminotransferase-like enzyme
METTYFAELIEFLAHPSMLGIIAISVSALASMAGVTINRRKINTLDARSIRRDGMEERATAFTEVMKVIGALRTDISDLRNELEQERILRRSAERTVGQLLAEVALLRQLLQRANIVLPPTLLLTEGVPAISNG